MCGTLLESSSEARICGLGAKPLLSLASNIGRRNVLYFEPIMTVFYFSTDLNRDPYYLQSIQSCLTSPISIGMLFLFVSYEWVGHFCDRGVRLAILPPPLESIALTVSSQPEEALVNPLYGSQLVL